MRYSIQYTLVHADVLFAIVCPDASTAATQRPQALRVYSLDLSTLVWSLISPSKHDDPKMQYPIPRNQAACTHKGRTVWPPAQTPANPCCVCCCVVCRG